MAEVLKFQSALTNYNILLAQSLPSTLRVVGSHMRTGRSDTVTLNADLQLMTNTVQNMNKAMDGVQSSAKNLNQMMDAIPAHQKQAVDNEVLRQLKTTVSEMPRIIMSLPSNIKTLVSVVLNMNGLYQYFSSQFIH